MIGDATMFERELLTLADGQEITCEYASDFPNDGGECDHCHLSKADMIIRLARFGLEMVKVARNSSVVAVDDAIQKLWELCKKGDGEKNYTVEQVSIGDPPVEESDGHDWLRVDDGDPELDEPYESIEFVCKDCCQRKRGNKLGWSYQQWWGGWHEFAGTPPCAPKERREEIWKAQTAANERESAIRLIVEQRANLEAKLDWRNGLIEKALGRASEAGILDPKDLLREMVIILQDYGDDEDEYLDE